MAVCSDWVWTSSDGLRLYARDYPAGGGEGEKRPVICLHGLTRNSRDFEDVAPWIAALGRRVLAVDVRGRGRSAYDPNPMNYTPAVYARDVVELAASLGIEQAVVIGTSMGGLIAMALASLAPRLVAAAVLNDVGPELSPVGLARIMAYAGEPSAIHSWDDAAAYAKAVNGVAFPSYGEAEWRAFARRLFSQTGDGIVADYDPHIMAPLRIAPPSPSPDPWLMFKTLAQERPLLLIRGALSDILPGEIADRMSLAAPAMRRRDVQGVGHAPMLVEPDARAVLSDFLDEVA